MSAAAASPRKGAFNWLSTMLVALVLVFGGFCYGYMAHKNEWLPTEVIPSARSSASTPTSGGQAYGGGSLFGGLGYLAGYEPAQSNTGVLVHDSERAYAGYNLYTSGHGPEAILMDMNGSTLHTWRYDLQDDWPYFDPADRHGKHDRSPYWRRAWLFENGDLLAIYEGLGLVKVDKDSNLLWGYRGVFHHDMQVTEDGRIFILWRKEMSINEDFITILSLEGELIRSVSVVEAFKNSNYASVLDRVPPGVPTLHTNTLEILDGRLAHRSEAFRAGNVLICARNIDVIAVVDLEAEKVVWALSGMWKRQHQPTVLQNGNMLLFDNEGHHGFSKVIEFDPFTQDVVWAYEGDESNGFYSEVLGTSQRLPNGNTLITDSVNGRAFEVTRDNTIVWEFVNPKQVESGGERLVAALCEMLRIQREYTQSWLN